MSDSPTVVATPYPTYMQGGNNDDDSFRAALTAHGQASIERNQDAQFGAVRSQLVHRDVLGAQFENERSARAAERESARHYADIKAELAAIRSEGLAREVAQLRDARQNDALTQILQLLKK